MAKIEAWLVRVGDFELFYFTKALGVPLSALFPTIDPQDERKYQTIHYFMTHRF